MASLLGYRSLTLSKSCRIASLTLATDSSQNRTASSGYKSSCGNDTQSLHTCDKFQFLHLNWSSLGAHRAYIYSRPLVGPHSLGTGPGVEFMTHAITTVNSSQGAPMGMPSTRLNSTSVTWENCFFFTNPFIAGRHFPHLLLFFEILAVLCACSTSRRSFSSGSTFGYGNNRLRDHT